MLKYTLSMSKKCLFYGYFILRNLRNLSTLFRPQRMQDLKSCPSLLQIQLKENQMEADDGESALGAMQKTTCQCVSRPRLW